MMMYAKDSVFMNEHFPGKIQSARKFAKVHGGREFRFLANNLF